MAVSVSHPRLQIKFSSIDEVPTFPDYGAGGSEAIAFRRGRYCIDARPKVIYRPPLPSAFVNETIDEEQRDMYMDEDESAASFHSNSLDAPSEPEAAATQTREQREDLLMSNSAHRGILKKLPNNAPRKRDPDAAPRMVRFADDTRFRDTFTDAPCTPRHPSTLADTEDVEMAAIKQEDDECGSLAGPSSSRRPTSSMFLGTVKVEPDSSGKVDALTADTKRSPPVRSPQPHTSTPERASTAEIPKMVVTAAPDHAHTTPSDSEDETRPQVPVTYPHLLSVSRKYAQTCLTFAHVPPHELFLHLRGVAHFLLQSSGSQNFTQPMHKWEKETLKRLRNILKNVLELTAIVKLLPSEVPVERRNKTRAKCVRRMKAIIELVDSSSRSSNPLLRKEDAVTDSASASGPAVKREEEEEEVG